MFDAFCEIERKYPVGVRKGDNLEQILSFTIEEATQLRYFWQNDDLRFMMTDDGELTFERREQGIIVTLWDGSNDIWLQWAEARLMFQALDEKVN